MQRKWAAELKLFCLSRGAFTLALITLYLFFILPIYFENNGGTGLEMPQNILAWSVMLLCILSALLNVLRTGEILISRFMFIAFLAVAMLLLPWFWTSSVLWREHAVPRLAGIAGALLFCLALCQVSLTSSKRRILLALVVLSSLLQAGEAMMQAWLPEIALRLMDFYGTSPYGIFQQRNLLASWLATGAAVTLYLALTATTRRSTFVWLLPSYPLCAAITLSQSRTGMIGVILSMLLTGFADWRRQPRIDPKAALWKGGLIVSLAGCCSAIGLWAMPAGQHADLIHQKSTVERVLMLEATAEMIGQHPWAGSGLGSFEAQFPLAVVTLGLVQKSDTVTHPHNEALYVWAEGGIIAMAGLLLLAGIWIWPLILRLRDSLYLDKSGWLLPLTGLPVVIHMMLEYPLYLSTPHLMLLLVLFRISLPDSVLQPVNVSRFGRAVTIPFLLGGLVILVGLKAGFITQSMLTQAEAEMNQGSLPTLPMASWRTMTQAERLDYDQHLLIANTPGFLQRSQAIGEFYIWGEKWLAVHNNPEVTAAMMIIAQRRGDHTTYERLRANAARVFIHDERFMQGHE
ncbi:O-antigen ligase family protein [Pantoea sp. S-LA4]|uniref:O-antigen ligase family protein n=1 Tax=Pantoea TaxID=53335 RepID=UPI001F46EA11|nr:MULTISPECIES: Wzy polymerase domain-containing protein [Pantoea]UIL54649.1 pilin glycosylation ligase domain-containing protein [Pantoea agglomerans]